LLCLAALLVGAPATLASHTPVPGTVTLVGSLQSELGCPGDYWDPACAATHLTYDGNDDAWQGTFSLPAGSYEYKVALNDSWDENYGAGVAPGGANIPITAPGGPVTFTYDHATHMISDDTPGRWEACRVRTGCGPV